MCDFVLFVGGFVVFYMCAAWCCRAINVCMVVAGGHDQVRPGHTNRWCAWPCGHCGVHVSTVGRLATVGRRQGSGLDQDTVQTVARCGRGSIGGGLGGALRCAVLPPNAPLGCLPMHRLRTAYAPPRQVARL